MRTFSTSWLFVALSLLGLPFLGCSTRSGEQYSSEVPGEDLPVVEADTDALPQTVADTADGLSPEASVDIPTQPPETMDAESQALDAAVAQTETKTDASQTDLSAAPSDMSTTPAPAESLANTDAPATAPVAEAAPTTETLADTSTPATSSGADQGGYTYTVQKGDTLMKVAYKTYGDIYLWKKVLEDNRNSIQNPSSLVAGTALRVDQAPMEEDFTGFERYLIQSGDTLGTISHDVYGTKAKWKKLWKMNDKLIRDPNRIYAGFFLKYSLDGAQPLANDPATEGRNPSSQQAVAPQMATPTTSVQ